MCPYFWQYVLTIMILPIILVVKFLYYLMPAKKIVGKALKYVANSKVGDATEYIIERRFWYPVGKVLKWFFISLWVLLIGGFALGALYLFFTNIINGLAIIGALALVVLIIFMLVQFQDKYDWWRAIGTPFRFIGDMVSNLYHEMCPLIKWE